MALTQPTLERLHHAAAIHQLLATAYEAVTFRAPTVDQLDEWELDADDIVNQLADATLHDDDVVDALTTILERE